MKVFLLLFLQKKKILSFWHDADKCLDHACRLAI